MSNQDQGPPESVSFDHFTGIKNLVTDLRLKPTELARGTNIDLDDAGQVISRRGYSRAATGSWSSLFGTSDNRVVGIKDGRLSVIHPDYSVVDLRAVSLPDDGELASMAYVQAGLDLYFSCAADSGIVDLLTLTVRPWGDGDLWLSPVVNPTAGLPAIRGRLLGKPPLATSLALWNGRIWMAQGRLLWATELYNFNYVDKTQNWFQFESDIAGIGAVDDGIYVGTENDGVWFLSGTLREPKRQQVMAASMIPGSVVYVPAELANPPRVDPSGDAIAEVSVMFMTDRGICGGRSTGVCYNLTEDAVAFPTARRAAPLYRFQDGVNQYVVVTDTGGSPASVARSGDHVDPALTQQTVERQNTQVFAIGDTIDAEVIRAV